MYDIIVIGAGPAGITASIYAKRSGLNVCNISKGYGALEKANKIQNYYGFEKPISGKDLQNTGIKQADNLGVEIIEDEVLSIEMQNGIFSIKTVNNTYEAVSVILATGTNRNIPKIKGIKEFEGKGISYCAICDAFFYRQKNVAILGSGNYAIHEAKQLLPIAKNVVMLTNTEVPVQNRDVSIDIIEEEIKEIRGNEKVEEVEFINGKKESVDGIFIAIGTASSVDIARKMGIMLKGNYIVVDQDMKTNIQGLYACGDCTGGLLQISKAIYEGTKAGLEATKYIRKDDKKCQ